MHNFCSLPSCSAVLSPSYSAVLSPPAQLFSPLLFSCFSLLLSCSLPSCSAVLSLPAQMFFPLLPSCSPPSSSAVLSTPVLCSVCSQPYFLFFPQLFSLLSTLLPVLSILLFSLYYLQCPFLHYCSACCHPYCLFSPLLFSIYVFSSMLSFHNYTVHYVQPLVFLLPVLHSRCAYCHSYNLFSPLRFCI